MTYDLLIAGELDTQRLAAALAAMTRAPVEAVDVADEDADDRDWDAMVLCTVRRTSGDVRLVLDIYTRDTIAVHFTSLYASNKVAGKSVLSANSMRGGINYDLNLRPRLFAFGSVDLEFDEFQGLDLRFVPAGGLGFHAVKGERTALDLFGGGALNREFFSTGLKRTSGEVLAGDDLVYKLSSITSLHQRLVFYPNVSRPGEYRTNFDLSTVTTLKKWLAWQLSASDRFLSNPLAGRKRNDFIFTTGFRVTFAK